MPDLPQFQALVNALGWMLVHFLWQGFVIAGLLWVACRYSRTADAAFRYWSGLSAYLLAALVALVTFFVYLPAAPHPATGTATLPAVTAAAGVWPSFGQFVHAGMEPALPLVVCFWALGVLVLSARTFVGWLAARGLVRRDAEPVSDELQRLANRLMHRLGVRHAVRVLSSVRVAVPTVIGWLRPVILLPAGVIARLPVAQLEMVIAHELGHIRRHDYLVNLLQLVIETLFFYHPAVRWMSRLVRQEREYCCDDLVVSQCGRPVIYARALANLEVLRDASPATALSATGGDLFYRVRRIVRGDLPRNSSGFAQLALLLSVAAVVSLGTRQGLEMGRNALESARFQPVASERGATRLQTAERSRWIAGIWRYANSAQPLGGHERTTDPAIADAPLERNPRAATVRSPRQSLPVPGASRQGYRAEARQVVAPAPTASPETSAGPTARPENLEELYLLAKLEHPAVRLGEPAVPEITAPASPRKVTVQPVRTVAPHYPFKARNDRVEGFVRLGFRVDHEGRVRDVEIAEAVPDKIFNRAAQKALKKWRFAVAADHDAGLRLYQTFDFAMADAPEPEPAVRERRCDSTGSKICGMFYNRDHVQHYGAQQKREAASRRN